MIEQAIQINPIDFKPDIAVGLKLPLVSSSNSFFALNYTTFEQLKTNLKNLILTEKGERYMLPDYGAGLKQFLFSGIDEDIVVALDDHIRLTVAKWLPQVAILSINIKENTRASNALTLIIEFQELINPNNHDTLSIDYMLTK